MGFTDTFQRRRQAWKSYRALHHDTVALTLLCLFGFVLQLRPITPFLTTYLQDPSIGKNLSTSTINVQLFPVQTYSYLILIIPVMLLVDLVRYKSLMVIEGALYGTGYILYLGGHQLGVYQLAEFLFGFGKACEVAYFSYAYVALQNVPFIKDTGYVWAYFLLGKCAAFTLGQILMTTTDYQAYTAVLIVSIVASYIAVVAAIFLPQVPKPLKLTTDDDIRPYPATNYVTRRKPASISVVQVTETTSIDRDGSSILEENTSVDAQGNRPNQNTGETTGQANAAFSLADENQAVADSQSNGTAFPAVLDLNADSSDGRNATSDMQFVDSSVVHPNRSVFGRFVDRNCALIFKDFRTCFDSRVVVQWTIWWTISTCVYVQVTEYSGYLWEIILKEHGTEASDLRTGTIMAISALVGAIASFSTLLWRWQWEMLGDISTSLLSLTCGVLIILTSQLSSPSLAYVTFISYYGCYHLLLVIASLQTASQLRIQRYGMVFAVNNFLAGALSLMFMVAFVLITGTDKHARLQFLLNGVLLLILGCGTSVKLGRRLYRGGWQGFKDKLREPQYGGVNSGHM